MRVSLTAGVMLAVACAVAHAAPPARPVVVELFTSEGCSSCPPADALLGRLAARAGTIALAWHVDYWNGPAWTDRFATPLATARQRGYAAALRQEVFTPALVIDGQTMVVGSDAQAVAAAIATSARLTAPVTLERAGDALRARIAAPPGARAVLAFYDRLHVRQIGGGENSGQKLREFNVVRAAMTLDATGPVLPLPAPAAGQGAALLIQAADLRVIGAARIEP